MSPQRVCSLSLSSARSHVKAIIILISQRRAGRGEAVVGCVRVVTGARFSRRSDEITVGRCDFSPRSDRLSRRLSDFSSFLSSYLSLPVLISLQARSSCQFFLTTLTLSFVVVTVLTLFHTVSFLCSCFVFNDEKNLF